VNGAAKAFAQAQEVMLTGDLARAADLYELADELAPSAPALRNAARARLGANHHAMAATHAAELLRRYPSDKESRGVAEAILGKLAPQLTQFDVACTEPCKLAIDGKAASSGARERHLFFTQPGGRTIEATFDGDRRVQRQVTALAGQTSTLQLEAPPRPAEPVAPARSGAGTSSHGAPAAALSPERAPSPARTGRGISRAWFIGAVVVTAGLGAASALQGMATLDTRDQIRAATAAGEPVRAMQLYDDGRGQQLRTNILLGATAAAGVSTLALAFVTRWSGSTGARKEVAVTPASGGGLSVVYGGAF
jgi:hypothetical protein